MATQWFGILTYAVYVVHEPIFLALKRMLPHDLSAAQTIAFTAAAIAVSIIVATCAYLLIERPFDEVKRMRPRTV
jgi:peptidoglycan/LPS O-acetylase OafA/YrhL